MKNTKIYIDGANVFYTQKKLGWSFDWVKIKSHIEEKREVIEWRYYVGLKNEDDAMQAYLRYLDAIGFIMITKPLKKIKIQNSAGFIYKANFDVEITADILLDKSKVNEILLFSGDSDFHYLVKKLKDTGKIIGVYSSKKTLSWELKLVASRIVYFETVEDIIRRR